MEKVEFLLRLITGFANSIEQQQRQQPDRLTSTSDRSARSKQTVTSFQHPIAAADFADSAVELRHSHRNSSAHRSLPPASSHQTAAAADSAVEFDSAGTWKETSAGFVGASNSPFGSRSGFVGPMFEIVAAAAVVVIQRLRPFVVAAVVEIG